ncbi:KUP system potassium uptake protein [Rhizomicrobium palustre]|uniref:Probable potassium transport system protein Kup n=1 Tax=Rhizomicrobium palustre TaxID=189966 RepID=A0A846MZG5_9PROT|nr:potassium transporter Kup [Rhizomicrobium palustre]NIK88491.1 KUP system potassium uptake protein [Rhizomicrobium palustre]
MSEHIAVLPASATPAQPDKFKRNLVLTIGALGIVYGDIGTSPLYALRESALAAGRHVALADAIMGVTSLIVWALILVVTVKYVLLIMRADNDGEGGILALASLAHRCHRMSRKAKMAIAMAAIFGLALFVGDGILTPAISVLSAVEGLSVESKSFEPFVLPLSLFILIWLFLLQSRGTEQVGRLFGPIMVVWFLVLAALGLGSITKTPQILYALNPVYGLNLFVEEPWTAFVALGSIVLAVTGCETLYADMGHFGKGPIRFAWLCFVFPALVLTYFGQGAAILRDPANAPIAFYSVAPHWAHYPLVILATIATIIASQAVISGVYSITQQAVQLGQFPRMEIRHTSAHESGQIYVPRMNLYLCIGVVLVVLIFRTSNALAAAYGIAVTGVMGLSTVLVGIVAIKHWHWKPIFVLPVFGLLALIDFAFLASNALKIFDGGWLPLFMAFCVFAVMDTWRRGRKAQADRQRDHAIALSTFMTSVDRIPVRVQGTGVFLAPRQDSVPGQLLHNLKHNRMLHERVVLLTVQVCEVPTVTPEKRLDVEKLGKGFYAVQIRHGFFETPDIPKALLEARKFGLAIEPEMTSYFLGRYTIVEAEQPVLGRWRLWLYRWLAATALAPARYYHLPPNRVVELGAQVEL